MSRPEAPLPAARPQPQPRSRFARFQSIVTRWGDNDIYGHVNNVVHYSFFDTAVNRHLIEAGALDIHAGSVIGLVVQTECHYFESIAFPQTVHAGLRVAHRGRSSVRYEVGLFADAAPLTAALGTLVHVYVDRVTRRPVPLPAALQAALAPLDVADSA
ncbi:MAG: acyl-CoA thioesterase [Burkholderiales bacterium]|nr:acyl-CoA thioesterase [Burkholderiales bacterium]MDE2277465.1 acyl-CoA thioesterase [Burkholderiales bacterium]